MSIGFCDSTDFVEADELEATRRHPELQLFDVSTIIAATGNFSPISELGLGGFGTVYKVSPNSEVLIFL